MNPRKFFDARQLAELTESVKRHGVLEPLVIRANETPGEWEIVCGARRYRAANAAGLAEVPVVVRTLSDDETAIIQLVENGQRAGLSPLEEAETFAALEAKGLTAAEIAKQLSRKASEVARRLPLARTAKRVKDALASGLLPVEYAELIARIPDTKLQAEALGEIIVEEYFTRSEQPIRRPVPFAEAKRIVEEQFMAALSVAIFDPEDAALSPLGACSTCVHLAGNNRDLFGDVKAKAVCTNPKDFRLKTENHLQRLRESGYTVLLKSNEVKRAFPHGDNDRLAKEFVDLESVCPDDPKRRRYEELLGRGDKLRTVFALRDGRVRKLFPAKDVKPALSAAGHAFAKEKVRRTTERQHATSATKLEAIGREAVSRELARELRTVKLTPSGWIDLLLRIALIVDAWKVEPVLRRHGFEGTAEEFARSREKIIADRVESMTDAEKRAFLVDLLAGDFVVSPGKAEQDVFRYLVKLANIDYAKVANHAIDEAKTAAAEATRVPKAGVAAKTAQVSKNAAV
jgi:ParB/RepB/Spo0J family partition protein